MSAAGARPSERSLWRGAAALAAAYLAIAVVVAFWPPVAALDDAVLASLDPLRAGLVLEIGVWLTRAGDNPPLLVVVAATAAFVWYRRDRALIGGLAVAVVGSQAMLWINKWTFARPRPDFVTDVTAISPAFPSGHATGSIVAFGVVACAVARHAPQHVARTAAIALCGVAAGLIGLSRILVHVHHVSDVVAGFALGGAWLLAGMAVARHLDEPGRPPS